MKITENVHNTKFLHLYPENAKRVTFHNTTRDVNTIYLECENGDEAYIHLHGDLWGLIRDAYNEYLLSNYPDQYAAYMLAKKDVAI
jgi:hypothetical protein